MEKRKRKVSAVERIKKSIVMVDRDDNTLSVDFKDKSLKIDVTDDYVVISTPYHKHIFDAMVSTGYNETYLFLKHFVEIVLEKDCVEADDDGVEYYSYKKLSELMLTDEVSDMEKTIFSFCDMWFFNIHQPLVTLQANEITSFIVYFNYLCNLANVKVFLDESKTDMTNVEYIKQFIKTVKAMTKDITERVVIKGISDKDLTDKVAEMNTKGL